jgi:hypothetical protein
MQTVFSHVIQKRFSRVNEDVATDALSFILQGSESSRNGLMRLLRGLVEDLPDLRFRTQQTEGSIRPDMCGFHHAEPRVFIENKFWAGLTDNQPVAYLRQLAPYAQPSVLLVVVPEAREHTLWRELRRRLADQAIATSDLDTAAGIVRAATTELGPILALTSWAKLLAILELEIADDPSARSDLLQLRALCDAADSQAFVPLRAEERSDHRMPALVLQLGALVQAATDLAVSRGVLNITRLMPQASWDRIGRYARFSSDKGVGAWFGLHFGLWRTHGTTPLWLLFSQTEFGRSIDVQRLFEPWAVKHRVLTARNQDDFAVALDVAIDEDRDRVVGKLVEQLEGIAEALSGVESRSAGANIA